VGRRRTAPRRIAGLLHVALGQQLIGLYLGQSSMASSYGAAGSVMILLLWVYCSCQILLLGAEFTRVYAEHRGTTVDPHVFAEQARHGRRINEQTQAGGASLRLAAREVAAAGAPLAAAAPTGVVFRAWHERPPPPG
jgi:virulence factor BrkB